MPGRLIMKVTMEDGTSYPEVAVLPGDMVRFETQFGMSMGAIDELSVTQMSFLAWSPLHRKGLTGLTFEEFCDALGDLPEVHDEGAAVPISPGP
jgi:hypothetical protein